MAELLVDWDAPQTPVLRGHLKLGGAGAHDRKLEVNSHYLELNGRPWIPCMGEFHYARYPDACWERELHKIKAGGVDVLATYVFWIHHEEEEGVFDFTGRRDLRRFVELCHRCGLMVVPRIGPFCHGEVRNGGLPDWLYHYPIRVRSNDPRYLAYTQRLYAQIGEQLKGLYFRDGGPIIGVQCENEFMDSAAPWETTHREAMDYTPKGADGPEHMMTLKRLAREAGIDAPLFVSTGWGSAPIIEDEFLPMFGGYAFHSWIDDPGTQQPTENYRFTDAHNRTSSKFNPGRVPFACCELGGGMQVFYRNRPEVPPESVEAMHVVYLGSGANLMGYYVYHGGINPIGRHSFLNEHRCPRISYDFQAPIREFGQISDSYHRLRRQFLFLHEWGPDLAPMQTALPASRPTINDDTAIPRCAVRRDTMGRGFLFLNNYQDHVSMPDQQDLRVRLRGNGIDWAVPATGAMTLPSGCSGILPLGMDLGGVKLRHASVQPLTRIYYDGILHVFFFTLDGMVAEYAFEAEGLHSIQNAEPVQAGGLTVVRVEPSLQQFLTVRSTTGQIIRITTLSDADSRRLWRSRVNERDHVFVSNADLLFDGDAVELSGVAGGQIDLWSCPPLASRTHAGATPLHGSPAGPFERVELPTVAAEIQPEIERVSPLTAVIRLPAGALDALDELLVRVRYDGDVAEAYLHGQLIHDNFQSNLPWEIGLKQFIRPNVPTELFLRVIPRSGAAVRYTTMAAVDVNTSAPHADAIRSIDLIPYARVRLHLGKA